MKRKMLKRVAAATLVACLLMQGTGHIRKWQVQAEEYMGWESSIEYSLIQRM